MEEIRCDGGLNYKAPPIGVVPKFVWIEERQRALLEAINRYVQADMKIPVEWVEEYNSLINTNV